MQPTDLKYTQYLQILREALGALDAGHDFSIYDANGDGLFDDKNDMFSYTLWMDGCDAIYAGMGANYSVKDENDYPMLAYNTEKMVNAYTRIYNLITNNKCFGCCRLNCCKVFLCTVFCYAVCNNFDCTV